MESKTEEEIEKLADQFMCSGKTIGGGDSGWIRSAFIEGYKSASQQLAEKDKEIYLLISVWQNRLELFRKEYSYELNPILKAKGSAKFLTLRDCLKELKESLNK